METKSHYNCFGKVRDGFNLELHIFLKNWFEIFLVMASKIFAIRS